MGRDEMRAADADRQAVAEKLKAALDEGRLDLHEYDERLQQAYAAKTYGDLEVLLTDLPVAVGASAATPVQDHLTRRWLLHVWGGYFPTVGIVTAIWLVSSIAAQDLLYFWPVWVAGPWGVLLIWQTLSGLAQQEPRTWQAKIEKAERRKQAKKERKALEAEASQRGELPEKPKKKSV
jgi:hypothetical protein